MSISDWEQRFRTPVSFLPEWSPFAPGHAVYTSNESGSWQVHALDVERDTRRQVTNDPVGLTDAVPTLDGEGVLWFEDTTGDESGSWLVQPFHGGETRPFLEGVPHGWSEGLGQSPGVVVAGIADREGFAVHVSTNGGPARELLRSSEWIGLGSVEDGGFLRGALSADGALLCLEHAEHGDLVHPALRVVDPLTGDTVGELLDEGMSLASKCWSPVAGDARLAFRHELDGDERPGVWNLATGERTNLAIDLEGAVSVADWWPDGSALLLVNLFEGRSRLFRYELESASLARIDVPGYRVLRWEKDGPVFRDPAKWPARSVATTGTHDTEPLLDWWDALADDERRAFLALPELAALAEGRVSPLDAMLELVMASGSELALFPLSDLLGTRERINVPGTVEASNWTWRMPRTIAELAADEPTSARLRSLAARSGRVVR